MKKRIPFLVALVFGLWVLSGLRVPADKTDALPVNGFGRLPVVSNGRTQPLDSLARNVLLQLREKQTCNTEPWKAWYESPKIISASTWLLEMFFTPAVADTRPVFRIDNPDLKGLLALPLEADPEKRTDGKTFSWEQVRVKLEDLQNEARRAQAVDESARTPFDRGVLTLWRGVGLYMRLQNAVQPQNAVNWEKELQALVALAPAGREAAKAQQAGQPHDAAVLDQLIQQLQRAEAMKQMDPPLIVAPYHPDREVNLWARTGDALFDIARGEGVPASVRYYAAMGTAYRNNDAAAFSSALAGYREELGPLFTKELKKGAREQQFNHLEPFYKSMVLYVLAGICVLVYMLVPSQFSGLRDTAHWLMLVAFVVHTAGLIYRMVLEGRPPVTNLYSSAVFIGWGACVLGLLLERFWKNGIGLSVASVTGFVTLIIAHHLSLTGDTMEMMRAVLDTNFWLATHVVVVTLGYSSTFVAGFLAILYVVRGVFTRSLTSEIAKSLTKMVYGIVCFATLFSFVGTVLGGIWADQSWGRFWGWDAKENGALMIVLWNAVFLHARWGGLVKERGLMALALVGNIVTAWSWFGVNMLGIGLHSYGFMSAAFSWLMLFIVSQLILIGFVLLPRGSWRSQLT
ncbi:MAG: cytochrome c biogenesis protein CcsA [Verrucomicrobiota bacterium]